MQVKINIFITDMANYKEMNEAYLRVFKEGVTPVRIPRYIFFIETK